MGSKNGGIQKPDHDMEPASRVQGPEGIPGGGLLACFGHPDDETFGSGGTLARCAAQSIRVDLVCATRGEVGEISDPALATPETLPQVREEELRCACQALGIGGLHLLGYRDSGMAGTPDNDHPNAFCRANPIEVVGRLVGLIRSLRPAAVLTFDPHGGYGHPDHVAVHRFASEAFRAAGDALRYPGYPGPHQAARLYYSAIPRGRILAMMEYAARAGIDLGFGSIPVSEIGIPDEAITTEVSLAGFTEAKRQAMQCHRTQLGPVSPFSQLPPEAMEEFLSRESFIRAYPPFPSGSPREEWIFP